MLKERVRREISITLRLNINNIWVAMFPAVVFAAAGWVSNGSSSATEALKFLAALVWSYFFSYVFDAANQAVGCEEDVLNKPHRPIPHGLVDSRGLWARYRWASALFVAVSLVGNATTLAASLGWVLVTLFAHTQLKPRHYYLWKPVTTWLGVVAQLAGGWSFMDDLASESIMWIVVVATMFIVAQPIEDVRDIAGDTRMGKVSLAYLFGAKKVCVAFCLIIAAWPFLAYALFLHSSTLSPWEWGALLLLGALCGIAFHHAYQWNSLHHQRRAYIVYCFAYIALTLVPLSCLVSR
ncbi:UbiA prenyltransferase [Segniliparus rotundus DSM 44985]|uniref:UbiA prenyltransferase n=2 Tax=Segniliparus rotundus TaxID=286802 RepID=D6ZCH3_SEGRD|nr:UbiA prenyltransferase [Segniliparus rotundus DSM 44985]